LRYPGGYGDLTWRLWRRSGVTYYVSTVYHRQETGSGSGEVIKHYRLGSQQVAVQRSDGVQDVLEWVLSDH